MVNWTFVEMDEVGSTQAVAKELASKGAPEGTTAVTRSQSKGKGRLEREWVSPVGGLYLSFVLRPGRLHRQELMTLDLMPIWTKHLSTPGRRIMTKLKTTETPFSCVATGVDLVKEQLEIAAGEGIDYTQNDVELIGAAMEFREAPG